MKLYFIGGENIEKREADKINKLAFKDAGSSPEVLVFPWTREKEKEEYRKIMIDYFEDLGASEVIFAELSDSFNILKNKINNSNLIYLPGGSQELLIKNIKNKKIENSLKNYTGIIIGNSAGALIMCSKYVILEGQDDTPKTALKQGLGLANLTIVVHFGSSNPKYSGRGEKEIKQFSEKINLKIYAIPENNALIYDGKNLKPIGDVYIFYKGKKKKL